MRGIKLALAATLAFACPSLAAAQEPSVSPFGAEDRLGASVMMTESKAIQGANLIRRGRVVALGRAYSPDIPLRPGQEITFDKTTRTAGDAVYVEGQLSAPLGQIGTRLNGPGHMGVAGEAPEFYNNVPIDDIAEQGALGIDTMKPFFTRGIMIDMVTQRGGHMEAGDEISVADIEAALDWQELAEPRAGDVVIFHTGWGRHWLADPETYLSGAPGIGEEAAAWLIERRVALIGADTWSIEVQSPDTTEPNLPLHIELLVRNGIFLHENLETERLIDAEISEFAYIFAPLRIKGATGSAGTPLAVY